MDETQMAPTSPHLSPPAATSDFPAEFQLLLAVIRWPFAGADSAHTRSIMANNQLDWPRFLRMATAHEMLPLVYRNLRAALESPTIHIPGEVLARAERLAPSEVMAHLRRAAVANLLANNRWQQSVYKLLAEFDHAGLPAPILLKGIPLATIAFGDPSLRVTNDIDLLVPAGQVAAIDAHLIASGFTRFEPAAQLTPRRFANYIANWKDFNYVHQRDQINIELHWRLHRNPATPAIDNRAHLPRLQTTLGERRIDILPVDDLFLYLCTHGALDGWYKLKWLADISALARGFSPERLNTLADRARDIGMLPEFSAALHLANALLAARLDCPAMLPATHATVARIVSYSLALIAAHDYSPKWDSGPEAIAYEFRLRTSFRYRWLILKRILFRPRMWQRYDLPDALFPLYALISPFEWFLYHRAHKR